MNVLIVDDNEAAADLLQELLSLQDHSVRCAYTAADALAVAGGERFDAALVDLRLPDRPGTEVAHELRSAALAAGRPLTLVAISGFAASEATGANAEGLFDHYLQKPIDFDALDRILATAAAG
ncbi:MAG: response regulator [Variovorax sp.]|nr:MAG: response regulator [Variovorax sp.]